MAATNLSDLLPIPEGVGDPHAYQVFGLEGGEQDATKIKKAVAAVYAKLKASKQDADPKVWRQAAKLAEQSKAVLTDPKQRAELDARFGIVNVAPSAPPAGVPPTGVPPTGMPPTTASNPSAPAASAPAADPLAGMLPPVNPMATHAAPAATPAANPMAPVSSPNPTAAFPAASVPNSNSPVFPAHGTAHPQGAVPTQPVTAQPVATPVAPSQSPAVPKGPQVKVKKTKRRKKSGAGKMLFVLAMCGLAAASAGLGVFVYLGRDIAITKDGELVGDRRASGSGPAAAPPTRGAVQPRRQLDPVMGSLAGNVPPPTRPSLQPRMPSEVQPQNGVSPPNDSAADSMPEPSRAPEPSMESTSPGMHEQAVASASTEMPMVNPDGALPVSSVTQSAPVELTDADIAENEAEISKVKKLIREFNWNDMRSAAEKVTERTLTDSQRIEADALFNLADLASYYRGGIERGLGTLKATQDFEVTEGFRVLVVEVSASSLTLKYNGRNKAYPSINDFPPRLAEKLASFAMDLEQPDGIAARSVYQAIAPTSNDEHREASIQWLEMIDDDLPDVDARAVAKQIKELYR